jgi:hypothetical protein
VLLACRICALLMAVALAALPPIAFGEPPDATWMGGYWDDDDFDSVVNAIVTTFALKDPGCAAVDQPTLVYVPHVSTSKKHGWRAPLLAAASPRAPPLAPPTHS